MKLAELIKKLDNPIVPAGLFDFEVSGIASNSKEARKDFVFVAVRGNSCDGHDFIAEALKKGARAVITQYAIRNTQYTKKASFIRVKDTRRALAKLAAEFYGNPCTKLKVVAVTGTNGKTTVTYLIEALLKKAGFDPAVIGTVNYRFKDKLIPSKNTTPGPLELQSLLAQMVRKGADYVIMEVSSHALDQARTAGINFHCAIFTNLTQDHLDYHLNMSRYFRAKSLLFRDLRPGSFAVINNDDKYGRKIKGVCAARRISTYGIKRAADVCARDIKFSCCSTEFVLDAPKAKIKLKTRLIGVHNVYNILAGIAFALKEGLGLSRIKAVLENFSSVPGRLERIPAKAGFWVFVDYAHTDDALKNVLGALRRLSAKRLIVVFGCGGNRDKSKRPKMGGVACRLADYAVLTNDNPRKEPPLRIIADIRKGFRKKNYCVIPDRRQAIKEALSMAKEGDIVLVAGKGHENYQIFKDRTVYFDDRKVAKECLASLNY